MPSSHNKLNINKQHQYKYHTNHITIQSSNSSLYSLTFTNININIKTILIILIIISIFPQTSCQQYNLKQQHQSNIQQQQQLQIQQQQQQYVQLTNNQTNKIKQILDDSNRDTTYLGYYQSLQQQNILNWLPSKTGQIYFQVYPSYQFLLQSKLKQTQDIIKQHNNNLICLFSDICNKQLSKQIRQIQQFKQLQQNYTVQFLLLNQRYITQQQLLLSFKIVPNKIKIITQQQQQQQHQLYQLYQLQQYQSQNINILSNQTKQICVAINDYQWQCNNTLLNYTKIWRTSDIDSDQHTIRVNYRMKIYTDQQELEDGHYDYHNYKIDFEIIQVQQSQPSSYQLQQPSLSDTSTNLLHIKSTNSLTITNRKLQMAMYSIFITLIIIIQIISIRKVNYKLTNNHAMASKLSLFVVSFCTIFDLFTAINFGYRVFAASSYFYRIFLLLPALGSGVLYFGYDVQMLTRVLITQFNNNGVNLGMQNPNFKKIFIIYYIFFFLSYQAYVLLKAFFVYQWWFVMTTYMFILLPQIIRNVRFGNGGDGQFDYWYVIGFLSTRNFIVLYENICPQNYLRIKPYVWQTILLTTLLVLQIVILYCQSKFGARFFIPKFLRPGYYQYSQKIKLQQNDQLDCVVCLQKLLPDNQQKNEESNNDNLNRSENIKQQMLGRQIQIYRTPCGHLFHQQCLKSWIKVKLECPTCRAKLPVM